jgi:hypothetical protein
MFALFVSFIQVFSSPCAGAVPFYQLAILSATVIVGAMSFHRLADLSTT